MAYLLKSVPLNSTLPVCWNVNGSVGSAGMNQYEDTYLVQYMLQMMARMPKGMDAGIRAKLFALQVTGTCDYYTIECIKAYQAGMKAKVPSTVVDGRITSAQPSLKYGTAYYTIALLNMSYRDRYWENWPVICADTAYADAATTNLVYRELFGTTLPK